MNFKKNRYSSLTLHDLLKFIYILFLVLYYIYFLICENNISFKLFFQSPQLLHVDSFAPSCRYIGIIWKVGFETH
jgi:hypothetical protein